MRRHGILPRRLGAARALLVAATALLLLAAATGGAAAQSPTGNLFVTVTDSDGQALPGVTVKLSGLGADRTQQTDPQGQVRFLGLDPGQYTLVAELEGFGGLQYPGVEVNANRSTSLPLVLQQAVEETITVTSESPLLDERKLQQGTTVSQVELEKIPSARDPWAILNQTPGVLVDRVNVGGNESGQQSVFRAQAVPDDENDFMMDGVQITDMSAIGASPAYYDFDQFAEMQFTTGGTDVTKNTGGVSVNLVTKRGTNEFRGSGRFYNTKAEGYFGGALKQSQPNVTAEDLGSSDLCEGCNDQFLPGDAPDDAPASRVYRGARIREIEDLGFEAGGAAVRDRVWLWGSWGQNDVQQNAASGTADDTILENQALKLNAQFTTANSAVASWNNGDKQKFGRGASTTRPDETTWNQRGPTAVYRFEDTHVFGSNLFFTGTYSHVDGGFQLAARGGVGPEAPESWQDADGVWHDSYLSGGSARPADELKGDASYFFATGGLSHELKVGGRFRDVESQSAFIWPGRNIFTDNSSGASTFVVAKRGVNTPVGLEYRSLWAQDTISLGRFTVNVGLRWDEQAGENQAALVAANPVVPNVLPAIDFPGTGQEFDWTTVHPRIGLTYALGEDRDTLLRASFAQFAEALDVSTIERTNPAGEAYAYFQVPFHNGPFEGDGTALDVNGFPLDDPRAVATPIGFDPANPTALVDPDVTDPGLDPSVTSELVLNAEHALLPEFVIGLTGTWRVVDDVLETRELIRDTVTGEVRTATIDDYVPDGVLAGSIPGGISGGSPSSFAVPLFALDPRFEFTGGKLLLNGSRQREYAGAAVTFTKRLANRWMLRGFVNYGEAEWNIDDEYLRNADPNQNSLIGDPNPFDGGEVDGDVYVVRSTGSGKGERFLQSSWSANLSGMYQVFPDRPWGFNVSANLQAREGYPIPYYQTLVGSDGVARTIRLTPKSDDYRLEDLVTADLRVEKEFAVASAVNLSFGIDVFNVTNEGTELSRLRNLASGNRFFLNDNVSPRIYRLGVRLAWK
jgi:hypothetical protein